MASENETAKEKKPAEQTVNCDKPNAYRVEDDNNLEEKDLKRTYLFGDAKMKDANAPGMEGQGMGGQSFGENNLTPAGNDKANPPQNAGEDNAYFRRTQPAEEHPEDENFVASNQEGSPGDQESEPNIPGPRELPDQQKVGENTDQQDNHKPNPQEEYREGTADNDGPGKPDQKS
ncbi:MAG: hypothetical protein JST50_05040 [Bacteroidetes bacterium]|jgi:hypothetical protein|nr:hypothetical protein [Bacteroidota bacterium]